MTKDLISNLRALVPTYDDMRAAADELERYRGIPKHWVGLDGEDGEPLDPRFMRSDGLGDLIRKNVLAAVVDRNDLIAALRMAYEQTCEGCPNCPGCSAAHDSLGKRLEALHD